MKSRNLRLRKRDVKLDLNRQTLRSLDDQGLLQVNGASYYCKSGNGSCDACGSETC